MNLPSEYPGFDTLSAPMVYLLGCRSFPQFSSTLRTLLRPGEDCVFCKAAKGQENPVFETADWQLRENDFPLPGLTMLLIIPKAHVLHPSEINERSQGDQFFEVLNWAIGQYELPGGGVFMRFGDPHYHVGTIPHLHANIIMPNPHEERREPLAKKPSSHEENYTARLLPFRDKLIAEGGLDFLFPDG